MKKVIKAWFNIIICFFKGCEIDWLEPYSQDNYHIFCDRCLRSTGLEMEDFSGTIDWICRPLPRRRVLRSEKTL